MAEKHLFTSESVTEGHPDKVADQISDGVLDAIIGGDPQSHVACETLVTTGLALIAGEISTQTYVEIPEIARAIIREIGYTDATFGFDYETCAVLTSIDAQSPDIAIGVDRGTPEQQGAGDQGLMFGYACTETPEFMPMPIALAHKMAQRLSRLRKEKQVTWLRPDGKTQVTIEYEGKRPVRANTVVVSTQHHPDVKHDQIRAEMIEHVVRPVLDATGLDYKDCRYLINPTGRFVQGGPKADCGLTGRKIIVDTYGGVGSHGGGAFSGKDPSKVDRSASYAARHVAKNLVAAGAAEQLEVQLAYAIGVAEPVSIMVDSFGTGKVSDSKLTQAARELWDLTPAGIIKVLDLKRPIYRKTAAYGHFGREEPEFTWERKSRVDEVRRFLGM
jgi:S-adenosylmethionine synthetase